MKKLILLFICLGLFTTIDLAQSKKTKSTKSKQTKTSAKAPIRDYFGVNALYLSQTEVFAKCSTSNETCSEKSLQIDIRTATADSDSNEIKYVYEVSGGKIIGEGANVIWDLSGTKPGKYLITAAIHYSIFNGKRWEAIGSQKTVSVTVKECPDCNQ